MEIIKRVFVVALCGIGFFSSNFAKAENRNFASLMQRYQKSVTQPTPWAGFWFPYEENGIANRWNDREMAPSEKYDQIMGTDSTSWEMGAHGLGSNPLDWWGHCNGWATAAILHHEPRSSITVEGLKFDVGDRKALITEVYQDAIADFVGTRVWVDDTSSSEFWDLTPAQFHLLLTNLIGKQKRSFIIDRYSGLEVWNQPMVAYQTNPVNPEDYLGEHPEYPGLYRVNVTTEIWWANDDDVPYSYVTPKFDMEKPIELAYESRVLKYELWLDGPIEFNSKKEITSSGDIVSGWWDGQWVGGYWKNGHLEILDSHPDFAWMPSDYSDSYEFGNPNINRDWTITNIGVGEREIK